MRCRRTLRKASIAVPAELARAYWVLRSVEQRPGVRTTRLVYQSAKAVEPGCSGGNERGIVSNCSEDAGLKAK
jgi:hypothetical protein